jgi:hypothetical protein
MRILRKLPLLFVPVLFAFSASPAFAAGGTGPWWHLSSSSMPAYIQPGQAQDEVQRVTVSASTGQFSLADGGVGFRIEGRNVHVVVLEVGEEPVKVQEALEEMYGAGNVEVTGGPGANLNAFEVYEVKFVGKLANRYVYPMYGERVAGNVAAPLVQELAKGRPDGTIVVTATNLGDAPANPEKLPITLKDTLPAGLTALGIEATVNESTSSFGSSTFSVDCALGSLSCTFTGHVPTGVGCVSKCARKYPPRIPPYQHIQMRIAVNVSGATSGELNGANVTGGEAPPAAAEVPITVSDAPLPFGVDSYEMRAEEADGALTTQAGKHPFQLTTSLVLDENFEERPVAQAKDLHFNLPPGLIGNPTTLPQCSLGQFLTHLQRADGNACPQQSVVGVATGTVRLFFDEARLNFTFQDPVYNLEPAVGEPARFGFFADQSGIGGEVPVVLNTAVRTGGDYGVTVSTTNISQIAEFLSSEVTFWGVPGDARHDDSRGLFCLETQEPGEDDGCSPLNAGPHPPPFLSMPTSCNGSMASSVEGDSWLQAEPRAVSQLASTELPGLDGCNRLPFIPQIEVAPDGEQASKPTGLKVDVHVPQEGQLNSEGLAQSNIKDIAVTLPNGVTLNPSAADGLQACSEAQVGYLPGESHPPSELHFTPKIPGAQGSSEALDPGVNFCPNASKIAEVAITTPLLPKGDTVKGFVYLASPQNFNVFPQENPFETHAAMYIVAEDPISGSAVKLPGKVELGGAPGVEGLAPGQIRSTFEDNPQLAFEDAELHFFGGERAPLASPSHCGTYTTDATFTPWSGGSPVSSQSSFKITSGPNGSPCPGGALSFGPSLASGTTNNNAGSFSELTTTMSREDGQQNIQSVVLHYPAGVSGLLAGVKLCGEAEANAGTCGPESQIGETIVSVGLGGDPFTVTGGKAYITGPYDGAPFGLSIVNPAKAGPFDLQQGRPVVVRAKIEVNPTTAALTITTDPSGPHAIPTIVEGFPLQIKHVNVLVNRPDFTFNPTNCTPTQITGAIGSAEGASSPVQVPFQVTNCASLKFAPKFAVATSGKNSKTYGTSLAVKLTYPSAPFGSQANIKQVKVELPRDLPSRLTTLQKACTAAQFDANPAGCPAASVIGHAKAITPLIPVPLEGPAYFVSNGGEAFPNLIVVLQGYGVTIDLVGDTFISKAGVTSSTFKTVPDAPVGSFELTLPEGKFSALTALGNLCTEKLTMPTEFLGQNGASLRQNTAVSVTGCPKAKALTKAQKLAKALKACKKDKSKREKCERTARKKYGPLKKAKKKAKKKSKK